MTFNAELGKRVRDTREEKGYSCSDIAEKNRVIGHIYIPGRKG